MPRRPGEDSVSWKCSKEKFIPPQTNDALALPVPAQDNYNSVSVRLQLGYVSRYRKRSSPAKIAYVQSLQRHEGTASDPRSGEGHARPDGQHALRCVPDKLAPVVRTAPDGVRE